MDATLTTLHKLATAAGTDLQSLQKALSTLTADELLTLQHSLLARTQQKIREAR